MGWWIFKYLFCWCHCLILPSPILHSEDTLVNSGPVLQAMTAFANKTIIKSLSSHEAVPLDASSTYWMCLWKESFRQTRVPGMYLHREETNQGHSSWADFSHNSELFREWEIRHLLFKSSNLFQKPQETSSICKLKSMFLFILFIKNKEVQNILC